LERDQFDAWAGSTNPVEREQLWLSVMAMRVLRANIEKIED